MSAFLRAAWLVAETDLRIELRTGEIVVTTGFFAVLVTVIASISFYVDRETARIVAPGVLWVAIAFAGVLALSRTFARERDNDAFRALLGAPIPRPAIYLGKAVGALAFLLVVEVLLVPLVALFFHLDLLAIGVQLASVVVLGTLGFVFAGTLFAAMGVRTGGRELVLAIALFPLLSPALLSGVVATRELLGGASLGEIAGWLRILGAFDVVFFTGGVLLFPVLVSE